MTSGRVLVTGASGFTGKFALASLAEAGFEPLAAPDACDLTDRAAVDAMVAELRPSHVLHLAAIAFVGHDDPGAFYRVNTVGTVNLLEALAAYGGVRGTVVLASSANVYGNARVSPITEATPPAPMNHYAASKLAMEALAAAYRDRMSITLARPFNYTGAGQATSFLVPKIVDHFRRGERSIRLGNLDVFRDFSDVRTVAAAYAALLALPDPPPLVNLCSGIGHSIADILALCEERTGHALEVVVDPELVRGNEVMRLIGSPALLDAVAPGLPRPSLADTIAWMLG